MQNAKQNYLWISIMIWRGWVFFIHQVLIVLGGLIPDISTEIYRVNEDTAWTVLGPLTGQLPFAVTIDHQTLQDDTVTIRKRDSMQQSRIKISDIDSILAESIAFP